MARFTYIVRDSSGNKETGADEAPNQDELIARLQARGLIVVNVFSETQLADQKETPAQKSKYKTKSKHYKVSEGDLVLFSRQLATLLGAGVTILRSLNIIGQQVSSTKLYNIIRKVEKNMEAGLSFHEAIGKHPDVFTDLWVNLIESGEASGSLALVLGRLASYLEKNAAFRAKIISALIYPAILLFAGIAALIIMSLKIIPTFAEIFKGFDIQLPLLTKVLVDFSTFLREKFIIIIVAIGASIYLFKAYIKTAPGKRNFENFKFKLPVFGEFFRCMGVERLTSEMSTLLESGVPILYSLEIAERSVGSSILAELIKKIKDDVRVGKPLGVSFSKSGFFDAMVVQMVSIGEEIGELPQMFKKINAYYQEYTETFVARIVSMFEPIILVFIGGIIGIMVIGMFLPIFQIAKFGS